MLTIRTLLGTRWSPRETMRTFYVLIGKITGISTALAGRWGWRSSGHFDKINRWDPTRNEYECEFRLSPETQLAKVFHAFFML